MQRGMKYLLRMILNVKDKERKRYSIRFTIDNPVHALAWDKLSKVSKGRKNDYVISCILESNSSVAVEEIVRRVTEETLEKYSDTIRIPIASNPAIDTNIKTIDTDEDEEAVVSPEVRNFLRSL